MYLFLLMSVFDKQFGGRSESNGLRYHVLLVTNTMVVLHTNGKLWNVWQHNSHDVTLGGSGSDESRAKLPAHPVGHPVGVGPPRHPTNLNNF